MDLSIKPPSTPRLPPALKLKLPLPGPPLRTSTPRHPLMLKLKRSNLLNLPPSGSRNAPQLPILDLVLLMPSLMEN
ncbi:hypothetical protein M378DRAFT_156465 [Amanita muscaria Koide BX008]|uniref:Uncharacterized protein n=1 Tax=Amanita muscaria (strain Koide BX008) TaxID=946122 RepID=A0A0C2X7M6_AMAMK|nr:hypothetical protein M378DRAFT_156465 [Amanita muscaria Koide BX008]